MLNKDKFTNKKNSDDIMKFKNDSKDENTFIVITNKVLIV